MLENGPLKKKPIKRSMKKKGVLASEIATRNRKSLVTFHRTLHSQCKVSEMMMMIEATIGTFRIRSRWQNRHSPTHPHPLPPLRERERERENTSSKGTDSSGIMLDAIRSE